MNTRPTRLRSLRTKSLDLLPDEKVIQRVWGRHVREFFGANGLLYFTDTRLLFSPGLLTFWERPISVYFHEVRELRDGDIPRFWRIPGTALFLDHFSLSTGLNRYYFSVIKRAKAGFLRELSIRTGVSIKSRESPREQSGDPFGEG